MAATTAKTTAKKAKTPRAKSVETLPFSEKLVLNQWLISLFGIDPLAPHQHKGRKVRPLYMLTKTLADCSEGVGPNNLHHFYTQLQLNWQPQARIPPDALLQYEKNIVDHTVWLNGSRERSIDWKYYQWLCLLFTEVYLDRYFRDPLALLGSLNVGFRQWLAQPLLAKIIDFRHHARDEPPRGIVAEPLSVKNTAMEVCGPNLFVQNRTTDQPRHR